MTSHATYQPGPAAGTEIKKNDTDKWELIVKRELRHPPERVWKALTDPAQLERWAPYDADGDLGHAGATVKLSTTGTPNASETKVKRAEAPKLLEFDWGDQTMRWELEPNGSGTKLTLWANIDKRFIAMGAAGWHVCLDMLERELAGEGLGRLVAQDAFKHPGWQKLHAEYSKLFGIEMPKWG